MLRCTPLLGDSAIVAGSNPGMSVLDCMESAYSQSADSIGVEQELEQEQEQGQQQVVV